MTFRLAASVAILGFALVITAYRGSSTPDAPPAATPAAGRATPTGAAAPASPAPPVDPALVGTGWDLISLDGDPLASWAVGLIFES